MLTLTLSLIESINKNCNLFINQFFDNYVLSEMLELNNDFDNCDFEDHKKWSPIPDGPTGVEK